VGGRTVLRVPFRGGFQVDLQCRDDDPMDDFGTEAAVRDWLPGVVGDGYADRVLWVSTYHFLQKVAESFTDPHRRVLLAGEAAHLFPPFGARGMNSGIADADAAAEAIAGAVAGSGRSGAAARRRLRRDPARRGALQQRRGRHRAVAPAPAPDDAGPAAGGRRPGAGAAVGCGSWLEHAPYGPRHGPPAGAFPAGLR
jgi:3-(3-hydroxy-phenyl)propionate hydroxylase